MGKCILCGVNATVNEQDNASRTIYNCQKCGVFVVSDLIADQVHQHGSELAAYFTSRKLAGINEIVLISFDKAVKDKDYVQLTVEQILSQFPKSFSEMADMILLNLTRMSSFAGEEIQVDGLGMCSLFYVRKANYDALSFVIKSLQKFGLLEVNYHGNTFFPCGVIVSPKGWDRISQLENGQTDQDIALIYLPPKDDDNAAVFRKVAKKAAKECGYQVAEMGGAGSNPLIGHELLAQLKCCRFLICDLTAATGSSHYAVAVAQTLKKATVLTCHHSHMEKLEFDTAQVCVLSWADEKALYLEILNAIRALVR